MCSRQLGPLLVLAALGCKDPSPPLSPSTPDAGAATVEVDAGSDAGAPVSGVDPEVRLVDLSRDEAMHVCSAWSARLDRLVPRSVYLQASCTEQAWPLSADATFMPSQTRCMELLAMCLANNGTLGGFTPAQTLGADLIDPVRCAQPSPSLDLGPCDATVGDLEVCSAALSSAVAQHIKLVACDVLSDPKLLDSVARDIDFSMVSECQGLQMQCPALMFHSALDGRPPL